jgi:DNA-binding CsgD family transcriptional regulator
MTSLNLNEIQKLNDSIQQIYSLNDYESFGVQAVSIMHRLVPSDIPSFHTVDIANCYISDTFLPNFSGFTPEMKAARYRSFGEHPIIQQAPKTLFGAHKISDFITSKELHSLEGVYQQYLKPLGIEDHMTVGILPNKLTGEKPPKKAFIGLALYRAQRSFTETDRLLLNLLCPHFFQAHNNIQQYQQLQYPLNHLSLLVIDTAGVIRSATNQTTTWLTTYFTTIPYTTQIPDTLWSWVKQQITNLNKNPTKTCLPLRILQNDRQLIIRLINQQQKDQYLLILEEKTSTLLDSLTNLGLSPRETEVLYWVMQGKDNNSIASQIGISSSTTRKHLESIYHKLGVKSRTEAIAQTLQKLGIINNI